MQKLLYSFACFTKCVMCCTLVSTFCKMCTLVKSLQLLSSFENDGALSHFWINVYANHTRKNKLRNAKHHEQNMKIDETRWVWIWFLENGAREKTCRPWTQMKKCSRTIYLFFSGGPGLLWSVRASPGPSGGLYEQWYWSWAPIRPSKDIGNFIVKWRNLNSKLTAGAS